MSVRPRFPPQPGERVLFIERMDDNEEIFMRWMNDKSFREVASRHLMRAVYEQITQASQK